MKYFCKPDERKGTCYCEFQRGEFNEEFWQEGSLLIDDDTWYNSGLEDFFFDAVPDLEMYGTAGIDEEMWENILEKSQDSEDTVKEALEELDEWARDNFKENAIFTIAGL